jgi:hypothetical protein
MDSLCVHGSEIFVLIAQILRKLFGPKREEVAGGWRRLHNEELHNYTSPNIIRVTKSGTMRWVGSCNKLGEDEHCIQHSNYKT